MGTMTLRPYQAEASESVLTKWKDGVQKLLVVLPTGCHAVGERLLMADGTSRKVEDIRVGDCLIGADGQPRTVLHRQEGRGAMYQITPVKGKPFVVSGNHRLSLIQTNTRSSPTYPSEAKGGTIVDVTVEEYLQWSKYRKHCYKLFRSECIPAFHRECESRPVDPYFLGVLLGDGGLLNSINVTTGEPEVASMLQEQAEAYGMHLTKEPAGKATTYTFVSGMKLGRNGSILHQQLVQLGMRRKGSGEKSVPDAYKYADAATRLEVIAGLIDTDGCLSSNVYDFVSKSRELAEDLTFMCRSVGLAAYSKECQKTCDGFTGTYYRVCISGNISIIPCRVSRRKAQARRQKKNVLRTGFSVTPAGISDYIGFTVDGDNRYLLDDFTITHNCGKTIVFCKIAETVVTEGARVLILAHRGELLDQAADKLHKSTGLMCATEKAEESCLGSWYRVVVGSVQTLMRDKRLAQFRPDYFSHIIVDEAHHALSDSYQYIFEYFNEAKVLGVTATPDRGDMRNLGTFFDELAYEYSLPEAIRQGYLCKIKAMTIPLQLDMRGVGMSAGDYKAGDLGTALEPYLEQIATEMEEHCADRKTVVFLPLVATSQKFRDILNRHGFRAAEVNGNNADRAEVLADFEAGKYNVLCNSMLLTEGWDCPSVDCIVPLRPTKVRGLYCQMVGRGTRLSEGKDHLLLLDFLWMTEKHELCHPASLICESEDVAKRMTKNLEEDPAAAVDIIEAEEQAESDTVADREAALAAKLAEMRSRKRKLVDPLQFEMSIQAEDLSGYVPSFGWEMAPPTKEQIALLEKRGIFPDEIENAGKAKLLIDRLFKRQDAGLTTPKQIRFLEGRGFRHVGTWQFSEAKRLIDMIAGNGWRVPAGITPSQYVPEGKLKNESEGVIPWTRAIS